METILRGWAGLDVHKQAVETHIRRMEGEGRLHQETWWGTLTADLLSSRCVPERPTYDVGAFARRLAAARFFLGASPSAASKATRDVTNFFTPAVSKSTVVRSSSRSTMVPNPYLEWRTYCPGLKFIRCLSI